MSAEGSGATQLTTDPAIDESPAGSPDGARITFASLRQGALNPEIYTMGANGSGQSRLSDLPFREFRPDWGPLQLAPRLPQRHPRRRARRPWRRSSPFRLRLA